MAMAAATLGLMAAATGYSMYSNYQQGKENAANIQAQAQLQAKQIQQNAAQQAQQLALQAEQINQQADNANRAASQSLLEAGNQKFKADEEMRQGEIAQERANLEQLKGEREASKRSMQLAQEIGSQYANFAANGIAVDASPTDTVGAVIKSSAAEGQADISTILENARMNQWTYEEQKRSMQRSALGSLMGANNAVLRAQGQTDAAADYHKSAASYVGAANQTIANGNQAAKDTLAYGEAAAKAAKSAGRRAMWGSLLQGGASMAGYADKKWGN